MMAEKKRRIELENQGNQLVANLQSQLQGVEKRLPPPGDVPSFYEGCIGSPFLWNELVNYHRYGEKRPSGSYKSSSRRSRAPRWISRAPSVF